MLPAPRSQNCAADIGPEAIQGGLPHPVLLDFSQEAPGQTGLFIVSQSDSLPELKPLANHVARCREVP